MTKYSNVLVETLDVWFKSHHNLSKKEYLMFKQLCTEVLKWKRLRLYLVMIRLILKN